MIRNKEAKLAEFTGSWRWNRNPSEPRFIHCWWYSSVVYSEYLNANGAAGLEKERSKQKSWKQCDKSGEIGETASWCESVSTAKYVGLRAVLHAGFKRWQGPSPKGSWTHGNGNEKSEGWELQGHMRYVSQQWCITFTEGGGSGGLDIKDEEGDLKWKAKSTLKQTIHGNYSCIQCHMCMWRIQMTFRVTAV